MWRVTETRVRVGKERTVSSTGGDLQSALRSFLNAVADPTIQKVTLEYETNEEEDHNEPTD